MNAASSARAADARSRGSRAAERLNRRTPFAEREREERSDDEGERRDRQPVDTAPGRHACCGVGAPLRVGVRPIADEPRNRPVPSARIASAESEAFVYVADSVPRPGVGSNVSQP